MSVDMQDPAMETESTASLISGALDDIRNLAKQQFVLTRQEVEEDCRRATTAIVMLGLGAGLLLIGAMFACLAASHGIHWGMLPRGFDPAAIPLWVCHAIVAGGLLATGGIVAAIGRARLRDIKPLQTLPKIE